MYYAEIGSELRGGKLKFRPPFIPEPNYAYKDVDVSIPVKQALEFNIILLFISFAI